MTFRIKQKKVKEKEEDLFAMPKEENKDSLFKEEDREFYQELDDDLASSEIPVRVKNRNALMVKANGKVHEITRDDYLTYQQKYGLEKEEITAFRNLGSIKGDYRVLEPLSQDVGKIFSDIDRHDGAYNMSLEED